MKPLLFFGRTPADVAAALGVSEETARRYVYGRGPMPVPAKRLARLLFSGDLAEIDPSWHGWRLRRGRLIDVETATEFTAGELRAYYLRCQLLAHYERQIEILTEQLTKKRQAQDLASWRQLAG